MFTPRVLLFGHQARNRALVESEHEQVTLTPLANSGMRGTSLRTICATLESEGTGNQA